MGQSIITGCLCLHDDHHFLAPSIRAINAVRSTFAFISRQPWCGIPGDWEACVSIAQAEGVEVILGDWANEQDHRQFALQTLKDRGFKFVITPDSDEILEPGLVSTLVSIAEADLADRVHVHMDTYWKSPEYVIRPREQICPLIMLNLERVKHVHIRHYEGGRPLTLGPEYGVLHHLSYAGPDERIGRKISSWSHKDEVVDNWFSRIWKAWDDDKLMRNIHPTHPPAYGFAERIHVPQLLLDLGAHQVPAQLEAKKPKNWPTISVVIPLYGNPSDIALCLKSLERCKDLLHEVIVIDNASPDGAQNVPASYEFVTLIQNEENLGFGRASNQGLAASTGEVGKWIFWMDADDTLPWHCGEILQEMAIQAPDTVAGFIVPVQFVEAVMDINPSKAAQHWRLLGCMDIADVNPSEGTPHVLKHARLLLEQKSTSDRKGEPRRSDFGLGRDLDPGWKMYYIFRRAILLRSEVKRLFPSLEDYSESVLEAFLRTRRYHHGARSLSALVQMSDLSQMRYYDASALPGDNQLRLHVEPADFESHFRHAHYRV